MWGGGIAGGVNGCSERWSGWVWGVDLKSTLKLIQVFSKLSIHLSAGGGGGVLYLVMAFRPFHTEEESLEVNCSSSFLGYILFWYFYKCNIKVKKWR